MSSPQARPQTSPAGKAGADPRVERSSLIIGRLARAFGSTLEKKGWTGAHTTRDYMHGGKTYERLYLQWPHETEYARHEYEMLNGAIREFVDGRAGEDHVKAAWTRYAQACLNPPTYKPRARTPDPTFPDADVPATPEAEMPAEPSERHALLFGTRGTHDRELVIFEQRDHTNPLEVLRWINKGYTHIKVRSTGEWVKLRFPRHTDVQRAKEERGETKSKKKYSDGTSEDHVEAPKPKQEVITTGASYDEMYALKQKLKSEKKGKGKRKK
jgi:hypothetical protein